MTLRGYSLVAALAICVVTAGPLVYRHLSSEAPANEKTGETGQSRSPQKAAKARVHLYFSDEHQRYLRAEDRTIAQPESAVERARSLVNALIEGPKGSLARTIPAETKLLAVFVTQDGIAYVDFDRAMSEKHPGGTFTEFLTVFSIVNTLTLNMEEIRAVKILIEGRDAKTLAGHIDIGSSFGANMLVIK